MSQIELFTFEAIPERAYMPSIYSDPLGYMGAPMFRVRVRYGGKDYAYNFAAYNSDMMLTESFLEHFLRKALDEFRKCVRKEADDKAKAEVERRRDALIKAVDQFTEKTR